MVSIGTDECNNAHEIDKKDDEDDKLVRIRVYVYMYIDIRKIIIEKKGYGPEYIMYV